MNKKRLKKDIPELLLGIMYIGYLYLLNNIIENIHIIISLWLLPALLYLAYDRGT